MSASCKGHFKDLDSQAAGLGAEVLFKAGGEWWRRGRSPGLPRTTCQVANSLLKGQSVLSQ